MKKLALYALALVMLATPVSAQLLKKKGEAPPPVLVVEQATSKPPLTVGEALSLLAAHKVLDGHTVIVKDAAGKEGQMMVPWDFGSGTLRLRIARNVTALAAVEKAADESRIAIIKEITKASGTGIMPNTPAFDDFQKQYTDVLNQPASVDLSRIRASELKLDKNEISVTALSALAPILDDDVSPK